MLVFNVILSIYSGDLWVKAIATYQVPVTVFNNTFVCSRHFKDDDFINDAKTRLWTTSVPQQNGINLVDITNFV